MASAASGRVWPGTAGHDMGYFGNGSGIRGRCCSCGPNRTIILIDRLTEIFIKTACLALLLLAVAMYLLLRTGLLLDR